MSISKTNNSQYALPLIGPTFWKKTSDTFKRSNIFNTIKHNAKKYYFQNLKILVTLFKSIFNL